jgi:hypothetical protein
MDSWKKLSSLFVLPPAESVNLGFSSKVHLKFIRGLIGMNKCELAEEYKHYFGDLAGPIIVQFKEVLTSQAFNENINAPFTMKVVKVF